VRDLSALVYWLIVVAMLIVVPLGVRSLATRWHCGARIAQLSARAVERLTPAPEKDQLADDLYQVIRRERLRADLARLRRILATDSAMSATRQLGNRLAHDWLLRELERLRAPSTSGQAPSFAERDADWAVDAWDAAVHRAPTRDAVSGDTIGWEVRPVAAPGAESGWSYEPRPPKVEILEIGRRR
jgi:hypothetical protein